MKTGDLVRKLGVSGSTIRRWALTFHEFLEGGENRYRSFTLSDVIVIATIHKLSNEGYSQELIQQKLKEGYRVEPDLMDEIGYPDGRMVPVTVVKQVVDASELRVRLERVEAERDQLLKLFQDSQRKQTQTEAEARQREIEARQRDEVLRAQIQQLQERIIELERHLGKAEGRLEEIDRNRSLQQQGKTMSSGESIT